MVIEAGVVAGYVISWVVRKARRAAGRLDAEADTLIDASLDKLHEIVAARLDGHPALADLDDEAAGEDGQVSELTRQQIELALKSAARKDETFGQAVTDLVARLQAAESSSAGTVVAGASSRVFTGDAHVRASDSGIAFGQVAGSVNVGPIPTDRRPKDPR